MSVAEARVEIEAEGFTFERDRGLPRQHIIVFRRPWLSFQGFFRHFWRDSGHVVC